MHKFLRAIGFSHITKEQLQHIFADIISAPTVQKAALDSEGNEFAELSKEYGLYRQDYCGCEFSLRDRRDPKSNRIKE